MLFDWLAGRRWCSVWSWWWKRGSMSWWEKNAFKERVVKYWYIEMRLNTAYWLYHYTMRIIEPQIGWIKHRGGSERGIVSILWIPRLSLVLLPSLNFDQVMRLSVDVWPRLRRFLLLPSNCRSIPPWSCRMNGHYRTLMGNLKHHWVRCLRVRFFPEWSRRKRMPRYWSKANDHSSLVACIEAHVQVHNSRWWWYVPRDLGLSFCEAWHLNGTK